MSDFEDSDSEFEIVWSDEILDEESDDDISECESLCLGDEVELVEEEVVEPAVTFGRVQKIAEGGGNCLRPADPDQEEIEAIEYIPPSLDTAPDFEPLRSSFSPHVAQPKDLPPTIKMDSPLSFFRLFVTNEDFATFAANTNLYAESKGAGQKQEKGKRRLPSVPRAK
ncbi:hypothetical protein P167DRAFT_540702 [Morchella conica CCBAS932]|uniref:PiggyBac transposable element-derived protein domain-containing protein n=1 Tax=Morchella conica CCBAS932 TaxID=1392247 RepID=A0A3N4KB73_9PEZI|nr:hypothetical protein P167DRAFT_540702 [Morchella conica CCBAS932]